MLNKIYVAIVAAAVLVAAFTGRMEALTGAILDSASGAVPLAIGLIGLMAFFIGLMKVAEDAGLLNIIARIVSPVMTRLFPGVPKNHPAMSAMILNIGANMMGLTNAATPFGIKAIEQLDTLNSRKGTATNDMVLFLAINTAGLALLPSGVVSLRESLGSSNPAGVFFTTWVASGCATVVGIAAAFAYSRLRGVRATQPPPPVHADAPCDAVAEKVPDLVADKTTDPGWSPWRVAISALFAVAFAVAASIEVAELVRDESLSTTDVLTFMASWWMMPALVAAIVLFGWSRRTKVYESLVEGAKEGFNVAVRIIPFLVAILVGVGMLRASGIIAYFTRGYDTVLASVGIDEPWMPAEALPMALLRPLSGSGAYGISAEIMTAHGPDSYIGYLVSTLQGSTETTFYVLAVYFGAVGVKRTRHALPACLTADAAGMVAAVVIVRLLFG